MKLNNKGFSLVELIVVIVILGVLVGIAVPNVIGYVERARLATDIATADNLITAANLAYAKDNTLDVEDEAALKTAVTAELQGAAWPTGKASAANGEDFIIIGEKVSETKVDFSVSVNSIDIAPERGEPYDGIK